MSSGVIRWDGVVTAESSIAHGAETLGTVTYLRRERFLMPDGRVEQVPVVSGNALRGLLRDTAADLWWEAAGRPKLTLAVMHALWSGGALAKISGEPLTGERLAEVKRACPVVGVFGTAGGGRIIGGALQVGKLIPICQETSHLLPDDLRIGELPSLWDLTQIEYYSRIPNGGSEPEEQGEDPSRLARYGAETFVAGTRFHSWMSLTWPTVEEEAFFDDTLKAFYEVARVGGLARAGHGRLRIDWHRSPATAPAANWRGLLPGDAARLREVLSWLD